MDMFFLVGILAFLYIVLRLVQKKKSKNLNHRKPFHIAYNKNKDNTKKLES
ncbi:hypothetical protein FLAVO9AF_100015 [Flavobacterium sp. 9AF]|nr:hypothetical protein FLAVO9AF_100015 [Flavobacterium sp. 9AF]